MRDDDGLLVGWGVGVATFPAVMFQGSARAALHADGTGRVEATGRTWARAPGRPCIKSAPTRWELALDKVEFRSGTSEFPDAGMAGGSGHTATAGLAIHNAGGDAIANSPTSP